MNIRISKWILALLYTVAIFALGWYFSARNQAVAGNAIAPIQPLPQIAQSNTPPLPGPQVKTQVSAAPLGNNSGGTFNIGRTAISSKFSGFGNYEQKMLEAVSKQWNQLAYGFSFTPQYSGTRVAVLFTLNQKGEVTACQVINSTASQSATLLCTQAIQSCSPFGTWTKEMTASLGEQQDVRIMFWYRP